MWRCPGISSINFISLSSIGMTDLKWYSNCTYNFDIWYRIEFRCNRVYTKTELKHFIFRSDVLPCSLFYNLYVSRWIFQTEVKHFTERKLFIFYEGGWGKIYDWHQDYNVLQVYSILDLTEYYHFPHCYSWFVKKKSITWNNFLLFNSYL